MKTTFESVLINNSSINSTYIFMEVEVDEDVEVPVTRKHLFKLYAEFLEY